MLYNVLTVIGYFSEYETVQLDCYMYKSSIYNCHPAHPCQATSLILEKVSYDGSIRMARDDSFTRGTVRNKVNVVCKSADVTSPA